jgi:hypothetical protein
MKAELIKKELPFTPVEIKITFESKRELEAFYALIAYSCANDKAELVNRVYDNDSRVIYKFKRFSGQEMIPMEKIIDAIREFEN